MRKGSTRRRTQRYTYNRDERAPRFHASVTNHSRYIRISDPGGTLRQSSQEVHHVVGRRRRPTPWIPTAKEKAVTVLLPALAKDASER